MGFNFVRLGDEHDNRQYLLSLCSPPSSLQSLLHVIVLHLITCLLDSGGESHRLINSEHRVGEVPLSPHFIDGEAEAGKASSLPGVKPLAKGLSQTGQWGRAGAEGSVLSRNHSRPPLSVRRQF